MLLTIPDLLSAKEVREARDLLQRAPWIDGRATAGHAAAQVKANLQLPVDHPVARQIGDVITAKLSQAPRFVAAALPARILPPRFNRYEGGGTYGSHVDSAIFSIPNSPLRVRSDISATVFLSDPEEYDGGELIVEQPFGQQAIKLAAGHAVIYPGSSVHRVTPVTRGTRFASFLWTQSLVRSDEQRRILFELDSTVQALAADHPGHASIGALTRTYHDLLRLWSDA